MGNDSERQCFINMYVFSSNYVYVLMVFGWKTAGGLCVRISITREIIKTCWESINWTTEG